MEQGGKQLLDRVSVVVKGAAAVNGRETRTKSRQVRT